MEVRFVRDLSAVFPVVDVYGQNLGETVYLRLGDPKYQHYFDVPFLIYNEKILPSLFYGKPVVLVEGVFDALSLIQEGIPVLAIYSNTIKNGQLEKIYRYTDNLIIWPDSDQAGEDGLERSISKATKQGFKIRVFRTNLAKDANDLLQKDKTLFKETISKLREILNVR